MQFSIKQVVMATSLLAASVAPAMAQMPPPPMPAYYWSGLYGGVNFGYDLGGKTNPVVSFTDPTGGIGFAPFAAAGNFRFPNQNLTGFLGGGQLGYDWQFGSLVLGGVAEIDGSGASKTSNAVITPTGPFVLTTQGLSAKLSWLGTARARLGWSPSPNWLFYGSGGLAFGQVKAEQTFTFPFPGPATSFSSLSKSDMKTGWAAGAGFEYRLTQSIGIGVDYIHFDLGSMTTTSTGTNVPAGTPIAIPASLSVRQSFNGDVVRGVLNFHFAPPPPPPPAPMAAPMPPPAAPKVFIVFFDWDRDTITAEGHAIIQQAADAYKSGAPVQIQVTGYTDRSGSAGYNQRLSERRANNVARALAALGVPREQMAVSGRGENDNRVPTADGVREPQNRRVEIVTP